MSRTQHIAAFFCASISFTTHAQQASDTTTAGRKQELIPVEIKAVRVNDKKPYAVSNLNAQDIKKQNLGQDLPYVLDQTPSVVINSDAGAGVGYTAMTIR